MKKRKVMNPVAVAHEWLSRGVMPIPIKPGSHKPKGGKGWNKIKVTEDTVEEFFEKGDNVGGLWGKPSGGIIDIDLDWDEAVTLAPYILPSTFMYGRASRPRSHYLYRCKDAKTTKWGVLGEGGSVIVELRSTGVQSVLPPSIHPEGERYEINKDCEFTQVKLSKLTEAINKLVTLSILAHYYPSTSGRHDYVHAVTGALLWSQWDPEEVAESMYWLLDAAADREDEREQRERTIINTIEKFTTGDSVNGWPTLLEMVDDRRYIELSKKLATRKKKSSVTVKKKTSIRSTGDSEEDDGPPRNLQKYVTAANVNPLPPLEVPGLIGKLAKWVHRTSYADQPIFNLGAAFTILALATQNRYLISGTNTPLSPFFMALGKTGGGKDSARQAVITAADQMRLSEKTFGGFQSFHALLDELGKPPHVMCWLWDEAARKLRSAAKQQAGADNAVITWLLDLYGKGNSTVLGLPGRKQSISKIEHPFMLVMAFAQPDDMVNSITVTDISTGLLNRFILLDAGDEIPPSHLPDYTGFPSHLADALTDIVRVRPKGDNEFIHVGWANNKTFNFMRDFREECRSLAGKEISSGEIWGRAWQNALILGGLIAVGIDHKKPMISLEIAEWATEFIRWSCNNWTIRLDASAARSLAERNSKHIERIIREPYAFRTFAKPEERELVQQQWMPRPMLMRICRHMRVRDVDESIAMLETADIIGSAEVDDTIVYWWKAVRSDD